MENKNLAISDEMNKLINMLEKEKIPFEINSHFGTVQVCYPNKERCICDVVCFEYSYGGPEGLLETMGLISDIYTVQVETFGTCEGYLTAETVFGYIKDHFNGKKKAVCEPYKVYSDEEVNRYG